MVSSTVEFSCTIMKRYLKLTSDFKHFTAQLETKGQEGAERTDLKLEWTCSLNLTSVKEISLLNCQVYPLESQRHGYAISVTSNLVRGKIFNPKNEIACIFIPKNSRAILNSSEYGESSMTHSRLYKAKFRFIPEKIRFN